MFTAEPESAGHSSTERGRGEAEGEEEGERDSQEVPPHSLGGRLPVPTSQSAAMTFDPIFTLQTMYYYVLDINFLVLVKKHFSSQNFAASNTVQNLK